MVRKIIAVSIVAVIALTCAIGTTAHAANYTAYDGNLSSTYTTYFEDILSNCSINDNYVYFRDSQYGYSMVVGQLDYVSGSFVLLDKGTIYHIDNSGSNYNTHYTYSVEEIDTFNLIVGDKIVYSDLGNFPQLEERSAKYEILQTVLVSIACLCVVIRSIFNHSKRRVFEQ